jgi:hypothetical protein
MQEHRGRERHGPTSRAHASIRRRRVFVVRRRSTAGFRSPCVSSACISLAHTPRSRLGRRTRTPRGVHALAAASYPPAAHACRCRRRTRALMRQGCLASKRAASVCVGYKRVPPIPPRVSTAARRSAIAATAASSHLCKLPPPANPS